MAFNPKEYETVDERNRKFWDRYPEGRLVTEILYQDGTRYIVRAEAYRHADDAAPAGTGHAEEIVTAKGVNQTSALENCETSAEGRALARLGFAPKGARPSREEMEKTERQAPPRQRQAAGEGNGQPSNGHPAGQDTPEAARAALLKVCARLGLPTDVVGKRYVGEHKTALSVETDPGKIRRFTADVETKAAAERAKTAEGAKAAEVPA